MQQLKCKRSLLIHLLHGFHISFHRFFTSTFFYSLTVLADQVSAVHDAQERLASKHKQDDEEKFA